ncbi:hypothetical protein P609_15045 [Comamonas thiooxydans]|nr:hypothetical protein P609_15045 [Comamonas thiooxydans]
MCADSGQFYVRTGSQLQACEYATIAVGLLEKNDCSARNLLAKNPEEKQQVNDLTRHSTVRMVKPYSQA